MKKVLFALFALLAGAAVWSLDLTRSAAAVNVDGSIGPNEYGWSTGGQQLKLYLSLSQDGATLYVAIEAATSGWVSVGLGSRRMNGAYIVMGADGKVVEQAGAGHTHSDVARAQTVKRAHAAKGGTSVLEFAVPAASYVKGGALDLIVGYGRSSSLGSMHAAEGSTRVTVR